METSVVSKICELFTETPLLGYALLVGLFACVRAALRLIFLVIRIIRNIIRRYLRIALATLAIGVIPGHDAITAESGYTEPGQVVTTGMPNGIETDNATAFFQQWTAKIRNGLNR